MLTNLAFGKAILSLVTSWLPERSIELYKKKILRAIDIIQMFACYGFLGSLKN